MQLSNIQNMLIQMVPFMMAIVFHEVAHGFVARKFGDRTAEQMGRLTLNPVPHIDPIGTLLFPMINMLIGWNFMFGWAKPVPVNFNGLKPYRKGLFFTAFAGPGINIILGFFGALFYILIRKYVPNDFYFYDPILLMSDAFIQINFALAIFNLIPLPPLDGSKMIESFMKHETARKFESFQQYSFFIILALMWTGALNVIGYPIMILYQLSVGAWFSILN